jgi:vacuolar-type H+-ATPase subunit E/Vma4
MTENKIVTDAQEQVAQIIKQGQETTAAAVKAWTDAVQATAPAVFNRAQAEEYTERLTKAVDEAFETANKVFAAQREFVQSLVNAVEPAIKSVREQFEKVGA